MGFPGSPAECRAAAPQCKAFVDDMKAKLGASHVIQCTGSSITTVEISGHGVSLSGHAMPKNTTKVISIDVCDDRYLSFFKDTLAPNGTYQMLEFDSVNWMFM